MASDLGFFSIVWGVLILAFSTAMLGAGARDGIRDQQEHTNDQDGGGAVMTSWSMWWFLQTYFQSLGQVHLLIRYLALLTYVCNPLQSMIIIPINVSSLLFIICGKKSLYLTNSD
jgi:hypothetical protein